jgi:hypothetical protein
MFIQDFILLNLSRASHSARRPEPIEAFDSQNALCAQHAQTLAAPAPQTPAVSLQQSFFDRSSSANKTPN